MSRWLAIDYGHKRVGVAVGDTDDKIATPVTVLSVGAETALSEEIARLAETYRAEGIVVGWPLLLDDTEGPQGVATRAFAARLAEATGKDVRLWDERLSSFQADAALAGQWTRKKRRARQDAVAAASFLGEFLREGGAKTAPTPDQAAPKEKE